MRKRLGFITVLLFMIFSAVPVFTQSPGAEKIDAYFFYEELCSVCHNDDVMFSSILKEKLPPAERNQYANTFQLINIFYAAGREAYLRVTDELGLDRNSLQAPLLILGGKVFQGYDSIRANIREAYLTAAEDLFERRLPYSPKTQKTGDDLFDDYAVNREHATMVYFYRITCPECAEAAPVIDSLPETVTVNGMERALDIIRFNTRSGNNGERIAAFFEAYQVPDKDRKVPIVFFSGSYLAGAEEISSKIHQYLGEAPKPWRLLPERRY